MKTQYIQVLKKLEKDGSVSNLWAVRNYILRLSAIIFKMKERGYTFRTYWKKDRKGKITKEYVYEII